VSTLQNLFTFAFVLTSMLSMGLSLTVSQIIQPLRSIRLVIMALAANFVVVPAAAFALSRIIPLEEDVQIGLLLLGTAAGAPSLPKLAQIAKANAAFAVGLMTMLMVVTIVYLPIVLPLLLPGVEVDAGQIAVSLIVQMLVPLIIGLLIKARYEGTAQTLQPVMAQISNISLALLLVLMLVVNFRNVLALFGTGAILATLLFIAISVVAGYFLGGPGTDTKRVLALGTGQRNLAAAFLIATANFAELPNVLVYLAAVSLLLMVALVPTSAEFGKRSEPVETLEGVETEQVRASPRASPN
jgi:predicted Na+-dependent transporter